MRSTYDEALDRLLKHEGGYTNHPSDPGGPTKYGITIHDYRKYVKPGATAADVRAMPLSEAKEIYRAKYWDAQRCDDLPAGVDYSIFDYGVNSGVGRSGKVLRRLCGMADNTHVITDAVLKAVAKKDPKDLIAAINDERLAFLKRLKTWPTFGVGWGRRVREVRAYSLELANSEPYVPEPPDIEPTPEKSDSGTLGKLIRSKISWASIGTFATSALGVLTDWRVAAVIIGGLLAAYIIYERSKKP